MNMHTIDNLLICELANFFSTTSSNEVWSCVCFSAAIVICEPEDRSKTDEYNE